MSRHLLFTSLFLFFLASGVNAQATFGKFKLYIPSDDTTIENTSLGIMTGRVKGNLDLRTGGSERATLELYSYDSDSIPDFYIIRKNNGKVISLGLDSISSQYEIIMEAFKHLIVLDTISNNSKDVGKSL